MARIISQPTPPPLRIEQFLGVDYSVDPTQVSMFRSPDMLNCHIDDNIPEKRTGYERVFPISLGPGKINGLFEYYKKDGTKHKLLAHGTKLYTWERDQQPTEIYNGLANQRISFFVFNDKCYIMDGVDYLVYDGTTVSQVTPYVPTLIMSRDPAGGGEKYEDWNLIGTGFKNSFSADGVAKDFVLSLQNINSTPVTALVNNVPAVEGTDFTVNRITGVVTFVAAPTKGTNNVIITAYKTYEGFADRIKKCRFHTFFGGSNDTRVFISGNPENPLHVFRSGLQDPTYWPENGFYSFPDRVKGFSKQYDYLVVHRDRGIHQITYVLNNGEASFPSKPINDQVGTLATHSLQIIENNPVSLSKDGVYMLVASNVRDERNVLHISGRIDPKLLNEHSLDKAVSIDYDRKYWLALNGNVYILDYTKKSEDSPYGEWLVYDNISASCFTEIEGDLYFGSSNEGLLYRFKNKDEVDAYNDDGTPIESYWLSKVLSFGADERRKLVSKLFLSLRPDIRTSADIYVTTNRKDRKKIDTTRMDLIHYSYIDYSKWSYGANIFPQVSKTKVKAKKIVYFQLEFRNDKLDESMTILSIAINYQYQGEVR
jgi:hypothetical protein